MNDDRKPIIDPGIKRFATARQAECIDAVNEHGSERKAAAVLGVTRSAIGAAVRGVRKRAAAAGYRREPTAEECRAVLDAWEFCGRDAPNAAEAAELTPAEFLRRLRIAQERQRGDALEPNTTPGFVARELTTARDADGNVTSEWLREGPAPNQAPGGVDAGPERDGGDGYLIKGVSTLFDGSGNVRAQWVKTKVEEEERLRGIFAAIESAALEIPRLPPLAKPSATLKHLLNFYVFTDYHLGMRAWSEEGGADWDLKIATDLIIAIFEQMIAAAPPARVGLLAILGDFIHFDGLRPVTPTSSHIVDASGHYQQIIEAAVFVIRHLIDYALQRHEEVVVLAAEGNHDISGSMWLRVLLKQIYGDDPRITVIDAKSPYYAHQHGKTMLAVHHGHLSKKESLAEVFANLFDEMWGRTKKRYAHAGHYHHEVVVKENGGMRIIQHPTLSPNDSYSARAGYSSSRQASVITYHDVFGKVAENVVTPEMLAA